MFKGWQKEGFWRGQFITTFSSKEARSYDSFVSLVAPYLIPSISFYVHVNVLLQDEASALLQREVSMECADEKAGDAGAKREGYVHVRAKRGQATNSHSLAERVIFIS